MVRIGIDGADTSHVRLFTEAFEHAGIARVSAIRGDNSIRTASIIEAFAYERALTLCDSDHPFVDTVDAVLLLSVDWNAHLDRALSYLARDKRVFIDKPVAGSFTDLIRLRELVSNYPDKIFGGSALPHHPIFHEFLERFNFFAKNDPAEVEIFGSMDSYFMASHSYELASAILGDVKDAVVHWSDHIKIHSAIGSHETTISLRQAAAGAEHPWTIRARVGKQLLLCSFPLQGIYDGLLHALNEHLVRGSRWSPGISIDLALAAERSGHTGHPVSILELDLGDMIPSEAFLAEYRSRFGDKPL
ncbi:MAG TPA: hypothetical protein VFH43_02900 [Candidatus Kapabacteria bacterium]|nr:hypothetical protein [Candidatus Kapabacteria bacterium]